jgi:hypothetical protein
VQLVFFAAKYANFHEKEKKNSRELVKFAVDFRNCSQWGDYPQIEKKVHWESAWCTARCRSDCQSDLRRASYMAVYHGKSQRAKKISEIRPICG